MADSENKKKASPDEIAQIILREWEGKNKFILSSPEFNNVEQRGLFNKVSTEYLVFYCCYVDNSVGRRLPMSERKAMLIEALRKVFFVLELRDKAVLGKDENSAKAEFDVGQKFKSLMKNSLTEEFTSIYDVRKTEYFSYKYVLNKDEVGANDNALAAFAKRIALIVENAPKEDFFCKFVEMMAYPSLGYIEMALKELEF